MPMTELEFTDLLQAEPLPTSRESRTAHLAATAAIRGRRQRRQRFAMLTAVPVTVALGFGSLVVAGSAGLHLRSATSSPALVAVAGHPKAVPADPWQDSPYWYVSHETTQTMEGVNGLTYTDVSSGQAWLGHAAPSRFITHESDGGGAKTSTTTGAPFSVSLDDGTQLTWTQLDALPTDPTALRAYLLRHISGPADENDLIQWRQLTRLLSDTPASPALRDALYHVASSLPEVTAKTGDFDSHARVARSITFAYPHSGGAFDHLFLDPATGRLLQDDEYAGTPGAGPASDNVPAGTLADRTVYSSGPATSDHETLAAAD